MQDIIKPGGLNEQRRQELISRGAYIFLAYVALVTIAVILLAIGYIGRGREIDRLNTENEAQRAKTAEIDHSPTLSDPCGLDSVICPGEEETPIIQAVPAKPSPNAQNGTTKASYYDYSINGQVWSKTHRTTASREFPRGTMLEVCIAGTDTSFSKCVEVLVNDYGPSAAVHPDRGLDLSSYAFSQLAPLARGVIEVTYREIK